MSINTENIVQDGSQVEQLEATIASQKTEIQQLRQALSQEKSRHHTTLQNTIDYYEKIISLMPGHVYWQDRNLVFLGCNDLQAKQAGLKSRKDIVGKTNADMIWQEQAAQLDALNATVIQTGIPHVAEEHATMVNGDGTYLSYKVPLKNNEEEIVGILGISIDITERKRLEEHLREAKKKAEAANQAKTNFLAIVSHELRTPLNGIIGTTQILPQRFQDPLLLEHIKDIEVSATYLLNLVNRILDFSCNEEKRLIIQQLPLDIHELAKIVIADVRPNLNKEGLHIYCQCDPNIPSLLLGDSFRLRQVLLNLLGNAVKFTDTGKVILSINLVESNDKYHQLRFSVEDTGPGIPENLQQRIFERFYQIHSEYSSPLQGVGLGLAICKQIIEAMHSTLHVKSQIGQGTCFWFELKLAIPSDPNLATQNAVVTSTNSTATKHFNAHVLVVEDNALNQKIIQIMLTDLGCQVDIVADGFEAIEMVSQKQYDIVFMDIGLPNIDGLEVTKKMREQLTCKTLPIVALTAHVLDNDIPRIRQSSINDVLIKPITIQNLKNILTQYVRSYSMI